MRVYKRIRKNSSEELNEEINHLAKEGWRPGRVRVEIDSLYPHECRLFKDLENRPRKGRRAYNQAKG